MSAAMAIPSSKPASIIQSVLAAGATRTARAHRGPRTVRCRRFLRELLPPDPITQTPSVGIPLCILAKISLIAS